MLKKIGTLMFVLIVASGMSVYAGEVEDAKKVDSLVSSFNSLLVSLTEAKKNLSEEDSKWVIGEDFFWMDIYEKSQEAERCLALKWHEGWMVDVSAAFEEVFKSVAYLQEMFEDSVGRAKIMGDMQKTLRDARGVIFNEKIDTDW